ncbi:MAG TPA: YafY family protein [Bacteroidia bacterium]|nr:YafY family protein [Bacteroidia bacterium]
MNRIDRLTAILIQLQSKRVIKAQDIAERFSISLRTVYRDVRTLEEAGVPIVGEVGVGYSIMEGYRLPPIMFTKEEATAFLTAEKLIEKLTDASTENLYKSAMYKIKAVLRSTEKDYLENIDNYIEVLDSPYLPKEKTPANPLQVILKSITEKNVLCIDYFANHSQEKTKRNIEPVGIFFLGNYWHLVAYCQLRNDYRNFRTDRISHISPTNQFFIKEHPSLKTFLKKISKSEKLHTVVMQINKDVVKYIGDQKFYNGFVSQKILKDKIEMTFLTASIEGFARWYMMFGDRAELISPPEVKARVKEITAVISKKIK